MGPPRHSLMKAGRDIAKPILSEQDRFDVYETTTYSRTEFLATLPDQLGSSPIDASLDGKLQGHINSLQVNTALFTTSLSTSDDLDAKATDLWNTVTELKRITNGDNSKTLALTRAFACLLLDAAAMNAAPNKKDEQTALRLIKIACRATEFCVKQEHVALCAGILERAADHEEVLANGGDEDLELVRGKARAEYFSLRALLVSCSTSCHDAELNRRSQAWKQDTLPVAESLSLIHISEPTRPY